MDRPPAGKPPYHNESLRRAFAILSCFSLRAPTRSLNAICAATALPKPTVFRLLAALEEARFVSRTPDKQSYEIGIRAFELGSLFLSNLSIERVARPVMDALSRELGMACNLAILDDGQVMYVAITDLRAPPLQRTIVGYRHFVHCSALGKALIAPLSDVEIRAIVHRHGMPALSPHTITDAEALLADVERVRRRGYALDDEEGAVGMRCLAAPIFDHNGSVAAAISVSGPSPQLPNDAIPGLAALLQERARAISRQLGWDAPGKEVNDRQNGWAG